MIWVWYEECWEWWWLLVGEEAGCCQPLQDSASMKRALMCTQRSGTCCSSISHVILCVSFLYTFLILCAFSGA